VTETNFIYIIGAQESPLVKIGTTDDVKRRLREIQNMSPVRLRVIWHAPGDEKTERALHRRFKAYREWGEWFRLRDPVASVERALRNPSLLIKSKRRTPFASAPKAAPSQVKTPPAPAPLPRRLTGQAAIVHEALRNRISTGELPIGSEMPRSTDLAKEYQVPIVTAVSAVKHLAAQGIVVWPWGEAAVVQQAVPVEGAAT
jgi:hypothetical protein